MEASPMKVGLIAPPWIPVPPPRYGGAEEVIDGLARGLRELGHEVRLFTIGESTCPVSCEHLFDSGADPMWSSPSEAAHALAAYESFADVDVIHDHTIIGPLLADRFGLPHPPIVVTNHADFTPTNQRVFTAIAERATVVAISQSQARRAGPVRIDAVIHHGIDLEAFQPGTGDGGYLLFVGRMSPDKGVDTVIRIAHAAGLPLRIGAKLRDPDERVYFEDVIRPMLGPDDEPPSELSVEERNDLLQHAIALINPIRWAEPFGLVMIEALASATPVVAFPHGAAPEIVLPGITGYLPPTEQLAIDSVRQVATLDRRACRRDAEERFSFQRMARDYEHVYRRAVEGALLVPRQPAGDKPAGDAPKPGERQGGRSRRARDRIMEGAR
jgi:glycosyltransferase involved in cell wall biosynthesis